MAKFYDKISLSVIDRTFVLIIIARYKKFLFQANQFSLSIRVDEILVSQIPDIIIDLLIRFAVRKYRLSQAFIILRRQMEDST